MYLNPTALWDSTICVCVCEYKGVYLSARSRQSEAKCEGACRNMFIFRMTFSCDKRLRTIVAWECPLGEAHKRDLKYNEGFATIFNILNKI